MCEPIEEIFVNLLAPYRDIQKWYLLESYPMKKKKFTRDMYGYNFTQSLLLPIFFNRGIVTENDCKSFYTDKEAKNFLITDSYGLNYWIRTELTPSEQDFTTKNEDLLNSGLVALVEDFKMPHRSFIYAGYGGEMEDPQRTYFAANIF